MDRKLYDDTNVDSILEFAKRLEGKTLREALNDIGKSIDSDDAIDPNKGSFGRILEKEYFGLTSGNSPMPDFDKAGIELKSTGLKKREGRLVAKERIKLNSINYETMDKESWANSHFIKKNSKLLLIAYIYEATFLEIERIIELADLWELSGIDKEIIRSDWEKIHNKIRKGLAHELSESDTLYLGACTSGRDSSDRTLQPHSTKDAARRSLCLKNSYVDAILWQLSKGAIGKPFGKETVIKDPSILSKTSFEAYITNKFKAFNGKTTKEIAKELKIKISIKAKNYNDVISKAILGLRTNLDKTQEFNKANIALRSIAFEANGKLVESISFPYFKYDELLEDSYWDESSTKEMFDRKFFFVIYKKGHKDKKTLIGTIFWNMPTKDIEEHVKKIWRETIRRLEEDPKSNLPGLKDDRVCHVRPHGRDAKDTYITKSGKRLKKYCFWLNAKYIESEVKKHINI